MRHETMQDAVIMNVPPTLADYMRKHGGHFTQSGYWLAVNGSPAVFAGVSHSDAINLAKTLADRVNGHPVRLAV